MFGFAGYPVVTLGFGFKSYVGYRMRQRKQRDVAKENEFYLQLMQQALPADSPPVNSTQQAETTAIVPVTPPPPIQNGSTKTHANARQSHEKNGHIPNGVTIANGINTHSSKPHRKVAEKSKEHAEHDHRHAEKQIERQKVNHSHSNGTAVGAGAEEATTTTVEPEAAKNTRRREKKEQDKEREATEYLQRLEMDTKRLRLDLQSSRSSEQDLRLQVGRNIGFS